MTTTSPSAPKADNIFLTGSLPALFAKTATPIILVMAVNGLFHVVDAYFLGAYVGPDALTAVTLMFPAFMILVALSTWVSNGFSSVIARLLGAGEQAKAGVALVEAGWLSILVCGLLMLLFMFGGGAVTLWAANGSSSLSEMGHIYMSILIYGSPIAFLLAIGIDTLRSEGKLRAMTAVTLSSAVLNIVFDYVFVVHFEWGVAGSAYGTLLAQVVALVIFAVVLSTGTSSIIRPAKLGPSPKNWPNFLALGAPSSLGYLGLSLSAGAIIWCLQIWAGGDYEAITAVYGIITRLMTFIFLPLLGLSFAFQSIVGNNFGANAWDRSDAALKLGLGITAVYCITIQAGFFAFKDVLGGVFVGDPSIGFEVARILPLATMTLFLFGPIMMLGSYFQAIGDAGRAAILGLPRTFVFALPLTFILPIQFGEVGIWYAGIVAEILMAVLVIGLLVHRAKSQGNTLGLFETRAAHA